MPANNNGAQPPGVPVAANDDASPPPPPGEPATANSLAALSPDAFPATRNTSRRALILFSGPYARPDGVAAFLRARGIEADQVDSHAVDGGGLITVCSTTHSSSPS